MVRSVPVLIMVCVLAAPSYAFAACRFFGTQLDCDLGANRVVIGTQAADEPKYEKSPPPPPQPFGIDRPQDDGVSRALPFELELQDIDPSPGTDLSVCRGNEDEIYCE
jgi:hypothetical protein